MPYKAENTVAEIRKIAPRKLAEVNNEWWVLIGLLVVAALINYFATFNQMLLCLFTLPTLFSAYLFGRRHAILTAFASVFIAITILTLQGFLRVSDGFSWVSGGRWYEITVWGGILVVTAYAMGTLFRELREVYRTLHLVLQYQMKNGLLIENSVFRTTEHARILAESNNVPAAQIEDLRLAATLIDLMKHIDPEVLEKTARMASRSPAEESGRVSARSSKVDDPLPRVARLLEAAKDEKISAKSSSDPELAEDAAILRLAAEYTELTTGAGNRKALSPVVARNLIARSSLAKSNPELADAFTAAFQSGQLDGSQRIVIHKLRRHPRVPIAIPVEIAADNFTFKARTEVVGGGGLGLVTPERLKLDQTIRVSLDLPRLGKAELAATVVWTRYNDERLGLAFHPGQQQKAVDEWIQDLFRDLLSQVTSAPTTPPEIKPAASAIIPATKMEAPPNAAAQAAAAAKK